MYVMRIHAKFQSSNKYLFFNYFLFQGVLLEIVLGVCGVLLQWDLTQTEGATSQKLTSDWQKMVGQEVVSR